MKNPWNIVMAGVMEHCDEKTMEDSDDMRHGAF